jgi:hypothetical protein
MNQRSNNGVRTEVFAKQRENLLTHSLRVIPHQAHIVGRWIFSDHAPTEAIEGLSV